MGFLDWLFGKSSSSKRIESKGTDVSEYEVMELLANGGMEFGLRKAAFYTCVNLLASYLGKAEIKYFRGSQEVHGPEYWRWNYEPNRNQNASAFWHQLVTRIYECNEVLIIDEPAGSGFVLADSYTVEQSTPTTFYRDVMYRNQRRDVIGRDGAMRIVLNETNMAPILQAMNDSFMKLVSAAMRNYIYNAGQHWKVAVATTQPNTDKEVAALTRIVERQIKPFMESEEGVLPQWEGYDYNQLSGNTPTALNGKEIREMAAEIWSETAQAFGIPTVLIFGKVADDKTAMTRLLSGPIDSLGKQVIQEANRQRLGRERVLAGEYLVFDSSNLIHYDIMENASNLQALIGSAVYSVNDVLRAIGKAAIPEPWAEKHYLTLNIGQSPVEDTPADAGKK